MALRRSRYTLAALSTTTLCLGSVMAYDHVHNGRIKRAARVARAGLDILLTHKLQSFRHNQNNMPDDAAKVHERTALTLLALCQANKGVFTKFGQHLASMNHVLPKVYTETLGVLQDQATPVPASDMFALVAQELGVSSVFEIFEVLDPHPIGAASLAQVHHGRLKSTGQEVAVKIQYPTLVGTFAQDLWLMKVGLMCVEVFFPDFQFQWILPEFQEVIAKELDFRLEKQNAEKMARLLQTNHPSSRVYIPQVFDALSTSRVLTMEYIDGHKVTNVDYITSHHWHSSEVASQVIQVFSQMIFRHGFVHCDPHPGNVFIRPNPTRPSEFQLVLLDHGLVRSLDEDFRVVFCQLWKALLNRDSQKLVDCADTLGAKEYAKYFPLIFMYRPTSSTSGLAASMTTQDRAQTLKDLKDLNIANVSEFMKFLPRDMLFVFRITNLVRSLNRELGGSTKSRLLIMGQHAIEGASFVHHHDPEEQHQESSSVSWWTQSKAYLEYLALISRLTAAEWGLTLYSWSSTTTKP